MSDIPTPHIIILLQAALDIPDGQAMNKRNMGVPYAIVCNPDHATTIIEKASEKNIDAGIIGTIRKQATTEKGENTITGVGLNKSNISF